LYEAWTELCAEPAIVPPVARMAITGFCVCPKESNEANRIKVARRYLSIGFGLCFLFIAISDYVAI
jgi:hypothetical protein